MNPVDTYIATGNYAIKPPFPYTPGSDGAGVVHSVGEDVTNVKVSRKSRHAKPSGSNINVL